MEENKLEYEAFCEELLRRLSDTVEESDSIDIQFQQMVKNNGWKRAAIVIRTKEERMTPVIYPDSLYQQHLQGVCWEEMVKNIWEYYEHQLTFAESYFHVDDIWNWENIKERLFVKVVATDMNREILETVIHKEKLDLSVIVYAKLGDMDDELLTSFLVKKEHLQIWNRSEDEVYETAWQNTRQQQILFMSMNEVISTMMSEEERRLIFDGDPDRMESILYVLTNTYKNLGAVYMLFPDIMDRIADELGGDLYILPSSIHEVLIMKVTDMYEIPQLQQIIHEVNVTQLSLEQRLSEQVYRYCKDGGLSIAT